jgi:hypothetical protein
MSTTSEAKIEEAAEKEAQRVRDKYARDGPASSAGNQAAIDIKAQEAKNDATAKMKEEIKVKESRIDLVKDWVRLRFYLGSATN